MKIGVNAACVGVKATCLGDGKAVCDNGVLATCAACDAMHTAFLFGETSKYGVGVMPTCGGGMHGL